MYTYILIKQYTCTCEYNKKELWIEYSFLKNRINSFDNHCIRIIVKSGRQDLYKLYGKFIFKKFSYTM